MMQRIPLTIAAAITAFVLTLIGGVAAFLATQPSSATAPVATAAAVDTSGSEQGLDPTALASAIQQRDAAYQQRIDQANQQLQEANRRLSEAYRKQQELADQLNQSYQQQQLLAGKLKQDRQQTIPVAQPGQAVTQPEPTAPPAPAYAISPDAAAALALGAAPGATLTRAPELVSFQGAVAYEVLLDRGTLYVDANSGQILYDGTATIASGGEHNEEGEHESGEHERAEHEGGEHEGGEHHEGGED